MNRRYILLFLCICVAAAIGFSQTNQSSSLPDFVPDDSNEINYNDLFLFCLSWMNSNDSNQGFDLNGDTRIDYYDLLLFLPHYGQTIPVSSPTPTLTPALTQIPTPLPNATPTVVETPDNDGTTPTPDTPSDTTPTPTPPEGVNTPSPTPNSPTETPTIAQPEFVRLWKLHHYLNLFSDSPIQKPSTNWISSNTEGYSVYVNGINNNSMFISFDRHGRINTRTRPASTTDQAQIALVDGGSHFGQFYESPANTYQFHYEPFNFTEVSANPVTIDHLSADDMMWTFAGSDNGAVMVVLRYPNTIIVHRISSEGDYIGKTTLTDPNLGFNPKTLYAVISENKIGVFYYVDDKGKSSILTYWILTLDGSIYTPNPLHQNIDLQIPAIIPDTLGHFYLIGNTSSLPYLLFFRIAENGIEAEQPLTLKNPQDAIWHDNLLWILDGDNNSMIGLDTDGHQEAGPVDLFPPVWNQSLQWVTIQKSGPDLGAFFSSSNQEDLYYMQVEAGPLVTPTPQADSGTPTGATITIQLAEDVSLEMVQIPKGTFLMGSSEVEVGGRSDEWPQHEVTLTNDFYMSKYEITNEQYRLFNPDYTVPPFNGIPLDEPNQPAVKISWEDANAFCTWLSYKSNYTFSLPTEAEWEYACRAGTSTRRYWGKDADNTQTCAYANVADASAEEYFQFPNSFTESDGYIGPAPVGMFQPNAFGLYDMMGNVWEWCEDWFSLYSADSQINPTGPDTGKSRVFRGGSWGEGIPKIRSAARSALAPDYTHNRIGFRVVIHNP